MRLELHVPPEASMAFNASRVSMPQRLARKAHLPARSSAVAKPHRLLVRIEA